MVDCNFLNKLGFLLLHPKDKSHAIYILNPDAVRVVQVFSQSGNKHIQASAQKIIVLAPELYQDVFPAQDLVLMFKEIQE